MKILTKEERAKAMYEAIVAACTAGRTAYLCTATRITKIQRKHLDMVRLRNGALEVQHGKRWLDYSWTGLQIR